MSKVTKPRIFVSYSRTDIEPALFLRSLIEKELGEGSTWHDIRDLTGDHWWAQIEDTIRERSGIEHLVLIASARALTRGVVRREWRLGSQEGKTITNVYWSRRDGFEAPDFEDLPSWISAKNMLDLSLTDRPTALLNILRQPGRGARRPFMANDLPSDFVQRVDEFDKLKTTLLDAERKDAIAINVALQGAGGFGKTVLAQAIAHDDEIYDAFYDGILWVTLGERPDLNTKLNDLLKTLLDEPQTFTDLGASLNKFRELLQERRCLLILDDVWRERDVRPFLEGAPLTARLITTRRNDILPANTITVAVDQMAEGESFQLLSSGITVSQVSEESALRQLAKVRLGRWPVLIKLVNGFLGREIQRGAELGEAIHEAIARLEKRGLTNFDLSDERAREAAVESTVRASLDYLVNEIGKGRSADVFSELRYFELAVFPEDFDIPISTVAQLWSLSAGLDEIDSRDLLHALSSLALTQSFDLRHKSVKLHDVLRKYVREQLSPDRWAELNNYLIEAYAPASICELKDVSEKTYCYRWLATHMHAAGRHRDLSALLLDPKWMQEKLDALGGPLPIISDLSSFGNMRAHTLIARVLRLVGTDLANDGSQLLPQLIGRLDAALDKEVEGFLIEARAAIVPPKIVPRLPTFKGSAITERLRLYGHTGSIRIMAALPNGKLLTFGTMRDDKALRLWDTTAGEELNSANVRRPLRERHRSSA